jgi:hypothetical protein
MGRFILYVGVILGLMAAITATAATTATASGSPPVAVADNSSTTVDCTGCDEATLARITELEQKLADMAKARKCDRDDVDAIKRAVAKDAQSKYLSTCERWLVAISLIDNLKLAVATGDKELGDKITALTTRVEELEKLPALVNKLDARVDVLEAVVVHGGVQATVVPGLWAMPRGIIEGRSGMVSAYDVGIGGYLGFCGSDAGNLCFQVTGMVATGPAKNLYWGGDAFLGVAVSGRTTLGGVLGGFNRNSFPNGVEAQAIVNGLYLGPQLNWDVTDNGVLSVAVSPRIAVVMGGAVTDRNFFGVEPGLALSARVGSKH